jgi:type II secretory pathway pseudopilin PulG
MSKRTRVLVLGAALAAMNLAGMTAVAHAQATNEGKDARRPPTQGQVGEAWHQPPVKADAPAVAGDTRRPPTESQVGEPWRHQTSVPGRPAEPGGQLGWRIASLGFLAAALALVGGLAVLAATRPSRRPRVGQAP